MRAAYRSVAQLIMAAVVVQAMVIALGMFAQAHDVDNGRPIDQNSSDPLGVVVHGVVGEMIIPLLAVLLVALALVADVAAGIKAALGVLAMVIVQIALGFASFSVPVLGLLHGLGAFAVLGAAAAAVKQARLSPTTVRDRAQAAATADAQP
jgi:hypothetical protein